MDGGFGKGSRWRRRRGMDEVFGRVTIGGGGDGWMEGLERVHDGRMEELGRAGSNLFWKSYLSRQSLQLRFVVQEIKVWAVNSFNPPPS